MYEHRGTPPLPRRRFVLRLLAHLGIASALVLRSLLLAPVVHRVMHRLHWEDKG